MTDSEPACEGKVKSTPAGSEIEPETVCLQSVGAPCLSSTGMDIALLRLRKLYAAENEFRPE